MRITAGHFFLVFFSMLLYFSCANVKPPQGGPRDTIPPELVESVPPNKSLNYTGNSILLKYNEYLKVDNLKKNLIITPMGDIDFEEKIRKNSVEIIFNGPLRDSTTYTLNFQSAIKDITEGNVSKDNTFAFSTGNFIDSMQVSGITTNLFTGDSLKEVTVGLYTVSDTFNLFKGRPLYFTKSDDKGYFEIDNIKSGKYFIEAFSDANNNLECDMPKESYGFLTDTLNLITDIDSLNICFQALDIRPLRILKALTSGRYFEIGFNKSVVDYSVQVSDSTKKLYYDAINSGKGIRFYNTVNFDSVRIFLDAVDSVDNHLSDTLFVKFQESKRKKEDFSYTLHPASRSKIDPDFRAEILFTKPVLEIQDDSIYIQYDSIHSDTLRYITDITMNERRTAATIHRLLNRDFLADNKTSEPSTPSPDKQNTRANRRTAPGLVLHLGKGAFISVEEDSSKQSLNSYQLRKEEDYGIIRGTVQTKFRSYVIQLVDKRFTVISQLDSVKDYAFINIPEGDYRIRVFIDNNNNGKWDPGDFNKFLPPEDIYFYPDILTLRANWELRDINLTF